jgi:GGDEF domain-containing protein
VATPRGDRRSSGLTAKLPDSYVGPGKTRVSVGGTPVRMYDERTGFFTLPVLAEFVHYEIDGYFQTETNERFVTPLCVTAIGIDALAQRKEAKDRDALFDLVAASIGKVTRAADRLSRRDDEIVALLRRTLARNVREFYAPRVSGFVTEAAKEADMPTTLSFGVASLTEHLIRDPDDMLAKAFRALEAAREQGPGGVALFDFRVMELK